MKTRKGCMKKVLMVTMNLVNVLAAVLGMTIATLGFHFYRELELPQGMDDMEYMSFGALALGIFGLVVTTLTIGGAYWLNYGSSQFKIAFCGPMAVIAYALIMLRGSLPHMETTMDESMMAEYETYYRNKVARGIVDSCQIKHECCGYFGIEDFPEHFPLPDSCCSQHVLKKFRHCSRKLAYTDPCRFKLGEIIDVYFGWMNFVCYTTSSTLIALDIIVLVVVFVFKPTFTKNPFKLE
ncbi:hypothetical protein GE061_006955 [Apolygus lucorum]|uniref:Uncharacterized protein n=1 Tax=Apolygus lucorum TaxID=248454 RepID=A0A6A4J6K1_APOLU|nr:hypothetical protein GE061_006955 [Apolygus lucorum]